MQSPERSRVCAPLLLALGSIFILSACGDPFLLIPGKGSDGKPLYPVIKGGSFAIVPRPFPLSPQGLSQFKVILQGAGDQDYFKIAFYNEHGERTSEVGTNGCFTSTQWKAVDAEAKKTGARDAAVLVNTGRSCFVNASPGAVDFVKRVTDFLEAERMTAKATAQ